ncbi:UPF0164 family protein [Treponema sp.]
MKRKNASITAFFIGVTTILGAVDIPNDTYVSVSEYLDRVYGIDANQGLTSLPVLDIPMGGRSEGMGTAFAAVADDISFIEWNPAGSSMLKDTELAFFHNNWIADTKIEGAVYGTRFGDLGIAAGGKWLYLPFTEYNDYGDRASKGFYSESVAILNASYNFLSGYYFSGISVGANLKGAFRFVPNYSDDEGNIISGSGASQSAFAPMLDLGALTRFNLLKFYYSRERNASVALVLRNAGPAVQEDPLPSVLTMALAYKPLRPLLFSFDYSLPMNFKTPAESEKPYFALGFSTEVTRFLSMRTGALVKPGSFRFSLGSAIALNGIDLDINYTLDMLTQLQVLNRVSLAARFNLGDRGRAALVSKVDDLYLRGLEEYARGEMESALRLWDEALKLNPKFDPAREGRTAILEANRLVDRIDEIQQLE